MTGDGTVDCVNHRKCSQVRVGDGRWRQHRAAGGISELSMNSVQLHVSVSAIQVKRWEESNESNSLFHLGIKRK